MQSSRIIKFIFGLFIIYIGASILLHNLGFEFIHAGSIFPFIIMGLGYFFLKKDKKILGFIFLGFGILIFLDEWFGVDVGDIIGFAIALAFIYLGYRLIRTKKSSFEIENDELETKVNETIPNDIPLENEENHFILKSPKKKHSLIGNCFMTGSRWELVDMDIWHGIGEVKLDLSRANIPDEKTTIIINGWIGDVDVYIPYDLEVSFVTHVGIGDINLFGNKEGGINRSTTLETKNYRQSVKRVEIIVNLMIGDIDFTRI